MKCRRERDVGRVGEGRARRVELLMRGGNVDGVNDCKVYVWLIIGDVGVV